MQKYRIKQIGHEYYPQKRIFLFFWENIKLDSKQSRDWYLNLMSKSVLCNVSFHEAAKDAWGTIHWYTPFFQTLEAAKNFIREYEKYLQELREIDYPTIKIHNLD